MSCETCGRSFLDAEDYRDHLPCEGTEADQTIADLRRTLVQAERALEEMKCNWHTSHYAHHDPMGTAGANCPACKEDRKQRERISAALAAIREGRT
jgi:hypothetical protein